DVEAFRTETGETNVINAASGYSTPAEFYFALRNTFREHPGLLEHSVLFLEAPGAMPDPARWSDPWAHAAAPEMLTPLLRREDLTRYWQNSEDNSFTARLENRLQFAF